MDRIARLAGSGASVLGTLFQLAVIAATLPALTRVAICVDCHMVPINLVGGWTPFIENLGSGEQSSERARCPGPQSAGTSFQLDHAPLPADFRPFDYADTVLACVRVDAAGSVRSVKLISGTGEAALDRKLVQAIFRQWRFVPRDGVYARPGWQRIRLSSRAPAEVETIYSPPPFSL